MKKILLVLCVLSAVALSWNCAWGAGLFIPPQPQHQEYEFDIEDGLHVSFKGAFRGDGKERPDTLIMFSFVVLSQNDMILRIDQSELFDSKATRFGSGNWQPTIGREGTWEREIIEGIPINVRFGFDMPSSESEKLPLIARARFRFNDKWIELRKVQVEEWSVWQEIKAELGL